MGGSESTRRVTLERGGDEGSPSIVKVSERVVRRLRGEVELPLKGNEQISSDELNQLWGDLQKERAELAHKKDHLHQILHQAFEEGRKVEADRQARIGGQDRTPAGQGSNLNEALEEKEKEMKVKEDQLRDEIEVLKKKNAEKDRISIEEFNAAAEEVKEKFSHRQQPVVCQHLMNNVINCYKQHPGEGLRCSQHVQEFMECVKNSRMANSKDNSAL